MVRANAKGRHNVRKLPLPGSAAGCHLPDWKTVHHLQKANQAAQLWRDDTLEAAGADGGEQPFINRGEMREDSHLQSHTVWRHFTAPRGLILTGKAWTKIIRCVLTRRSFAWLLFWILQAAMEIFYFVSPWTCEIKHDVCWRDSVFCSQTFSSRGGDT